MTHLIDGKAGARRIGFNMLFIDETSLSGPGYYAVQIFNEMAALVQDRQDVSIMGYVQASAVGHFPAACRDRLRVINDLSAGRIGRVVFEQIRLPLLLRRQQIDLLFSPGFVSPLWGSRFRVACVHDMYYAVIPDLIDPAQRRYWQIFIPLTARYCQSLIAVSTQTAQDIVRYLPAANGKIRVTKLASRLSPAHPATDPAIDGPYILMVANLTANKNVETVLAALRLVRQAGHELKFVHVGRDPDGRLGPGSVEAGVLPLGKVSDAALVGLYRRAVAVVNASLYEGFGMPAVEAQAMGAALISSDHPALVEAASQDGALFYDARQPEQLAGHIMTLLSDTDFRAVLAERGRQNAASLSWGQTAKQTLNVFKELLI